MRGVDGFAMNEPRAPKATLPEKALEFLRSYRVVIERIVRHESADAAQDEQDMVADQPQARRLLRAIGVALEPDAVPTLAALVRGIREWERADKMAKERTQALKTYLRDVRHLAKLEERARGARDAGVVPSIREHLETELRPQIVELRDRLGEEQHEIEHFLEDVGRSLGDVQLARGADGIADFIAGEIAAASGAYREWPTTLLTNQPQHAPPQEQAGPPQQPAINIVNSNTVHVNVAQMLEHLPAAIEKAAPPEKKAKWLEVAKELAESVASAGVKAALEKMLGSGR